MQSIFEDMGNNQYRKPILPRRPDRPKAQDETAPHVPNTPIPTTQATAKAVRKHTTGKSSAKFTGPGASQDSSSTSSSTRQRIDASHISSQPSQQFSGGQSKNSIPKPIPMLGGFRVVSKVDLPKVLAQNRRVAMEQIDHAAQTGVAKPVSSNRASSVLPLQGSSCLSIQPQDVPSSSKGNPYRSFQLKPTNPRTQ